MSVYSSNALVTSSATATITMASPKRHTCLTSKCPFRVDTSYSSIPVPANDCIHRLHRRICVICGWQFVSSFSKSAQDHRSTQAHDNQIICSKGSKGEIICERDYLSFVACLNQP